jgi:putative acetyltransferase
MIYMLEIIHATSKEEIESIRKLFLEYASTLNFSLCFQNFEKELRELPGFYSIPNGRLLLAYWNNELAGCIALRNIEEGICEMKRLFVRPEYRGKKIGYELTKYIIDESRKIGYKFMRLDTIETMKEAISLYSKLGFYKIKPYSENPIERTVFMELKL